MEWIVALVAGIFAAAAGNERMLMFLLGGAVGWLLIRVLALQSRLTALEKSRERMREQIEAAPSKRAPQQSSPPMAPEVPVSATTSEPQTARSTSTESTAARLQEARTAAGTASATAPRQASPVATTVHSRQPAPAASPSDWRSNVIVRWLLTGNVPVKVGVLVSFFGIAFLFKHAVDQDWVSFPIELRLALVAASGIGLLGLGWRLRHSHRIYALSIQGGGIGVLYLTAYAALRLFDVLPAGTVFLIMAGLAAAAGWLAVSQSARQLAVLGSIGGFLAPILASTGTGSHVALFSYYLVLNIGIAGVAFYRHWRMLNLLGFVFTFGIGLIWGAQYYDARYFNSVEPFLLAHFLLYTVIAVLSALKQPFRLRGFVDSALVFGLPLVAFPLQAALLDGETRPLAWSASILAVFYIGLAQLLSKRWPDALRLLSQVYVALGVIFATLAVPLWLDGTWVSNTWALEAAAMIFLGVRQQRALTHWGGVMLFMLAFFVYFGGLNTYDSAVFLLNERFIGAFLICASLSFCAWVYTRDQDFTRDVPLDWFAAGFAWSGWLLIGTVELFEHIGEDWRAASVLMYTGAITVVLERAAHRWVPQARLFANSLLPLLAVYTLWWVVDKQHPLAEHGALAWLVAFAALAWTVDVLDAHRRWLLAGTCWLLAAWLAVETNYLVDQFVSSFRDWDSVAVLAIVLTLLLTARQVFTRRYPDEFEPRYSLGPIIGMALLFTLAWNVSAPGRFSPLPYLPAANLLLLTSVAVVAVAWKILGHLLGKREQFGIAAASALFLITAEIARSTHHFAAVSFSAHSLWHSGVFQAALSIVWSVLGIAGMVDGARRAQRFVWLAGAGLMSVVVIKLFLVDLGNTGSVTRIVSFIGVGLLLLIVGYLAPAPNREESAA